MLERYEVDENSFACKQKPIHHESDEEDCSLLEAGTEKIGYHKIRASSDASKDQDEPAHLAPREIEHRVDSSSAWKRLSAGIARREIAWI